VPAEIVRFRVAEPSEADVLTELALRAKAHWGYPAAWVEQWRAELTMTPEYLEAHSAFVAELRGVAVGVCVLEVRGERATLEHLWVDPQCHGGGIGRRLVGQALEIAHRSGASTVEVLADPFAEPFYVKLGARRVRAVPAPMPGAPERTLPLLEFVIAGPLPSQGNWQ
jgi:predicted N-acetyltransferase YhbS